MIDLDVELRLDILLCICHASVFDNGIGKGKGVIEVMEMRTRQKARHATRVHIRDHVTV